MISLEEMRNFYKNISDEQIIIKVIFAMVMSNPDGYVDLDEMIEDIDSHEFEHYSYIFSKDVKDLIYDNLVFSENVFNICCDIHVDKYYNSQGFYLEEMWMDVCKRR